LIYGQGSENPDIIIITDYPSEEEKSNSKAFVGSTESLFRQLFAANNYSLNRTYRTTFCKEPAPGILQQIIRKGKIAPNKPGEYKGYFDAQCAMLEKELEHFSPKVIICTGDLPLWYLGHELKCRKFRGSVIPSTLRDKDNKVIPMLAMLPPRWIFADIKWKIISQLDISKAISLLSRSWSPFPEGYHLWTAFTDNALREGLKRAYAAPLNVTIWRL